VPIVTKKDRPLTDEHFADFIKSYGDNPNGTSKRVDGGPEGRFRRFDISDIQKRDYKLDITWLRDESLDDDDQSIEPGDLAAEAITELEAVVDELKEILSALERETSSAELEEVAA
jgi:type I restriction enzyme M protein